MVTKLARTVIYLVRLLIIKSYKTLTTCCCKVTWHKTFYIFITRVTMANKLGRKMTSLDGLLPIMSNDPLVTWPCEIRGSLTGWGSARKRLSRYRLPVVFFCSILPLCMLSLFSLCFVFVLINLSILTRHVLKN